MIYTSEVRYITVTDRMEIVAGEFLADRKVHSLSNVSLKMLLKIELLK